MNTPYLLQMNSKCDVLLQMMHASLPRSKSAFPPDQTNVTAYQEYISIRCIVTCLVSTTHSPHIIPYHMSKAPEDLQEGDKVSWNWGSGHPSGTVKAVYEEDTSITSKNGNKVTFVPYRIGYFSTSS